jgi:hypothetical protein
MQCAVMMHLIQKLDTMRAEESSAPYNAGDNGKRRRLRVIEKFLELHQKTCVTCQQFNAHDTQFVENSNRR